MAIKLSSAELTAVDDWRFAMRMPNRAEAIRALLRRGLLASGRRTRPILIRPTRGE